MNLHRFYSTEVDYHFPALYFVFIDPKNVNVFLFFIISDFFRIRNQNDVDVLV